MVFLFFVPQKSVLNSLKLNNSIKIDYFNINSIISLTIFHYTFLYLLRKGTLVNKKAIQMEQVQNCICRFKRTTTKIYQEFAFLGILQHGISLLSPLLPFMCVYIHIHIYIYNIHTHTHKLLSLLHSNYR